MSLTAYFFRQVVDEPRSTNRTNNENNIPRITFYDNPFKVQMICQTDSFRQPDFVIDIGQSPNF